jgi:hypothetical protein
MVTDVTCHFTKNEFLFHNFNCIKKGTFLSLYIQINFHISLIINQINKNFTLSEYCKLIVCKKGMIFRVCGVNTGGLKGGCRILNGDEINNF